MAQSPEDFAKAAKEFLESLGGGTAQTPEAMKSFMEFQSKFAAIALKAARENIDLGHDWTQSTLDRMQPDAKDATDPAKAASKAASSAQDQAKSTQDTASAMTEVTKKAQEEAWQLFLKASQNLQDEVLKHTTKKS